MKEITLLALINLLGAPQSDLLPDMDGFRDVIRLKEHLIVEDVAWDITLLYGEERLLESVWLSNSDIEPEEWSAMSLEMSSIGLRKASQRTAPVGRIWIVEETRLGLGLNVNVVFSSGINKSSVTIELGRCGKCIASL